MLFRSNEPTAADLRWFGVSLAALPAVVGAVAWFRFDATTTAAALWIAAVAIAAVYYTIPPLRRPIHRAWTIATFPIAWVMSHLILAIVYFGVLTPIGLCFRIARRDPLRLRSHPAETYWIPRTEAETPKTRYFQQS
jgi:hypothetical protein